MRTRRVLIVEDGMREEGGEDRTALIFPSPSTLYADATFCRFHSPEVGAAPSERLLCPHCFHGAYSRGVPRGHVAGDQTDCDEQEGDAAQDENTVGLHAGEERDRKSTRLNSSHGYISYAVFCLKKKKITSPT